MNRLLHQFARDGHLTFRKKWRDLIMQIFGHEALHNLNSLADVATCTVFDTDFYRLNKIELKDLAYRKLFNPFKWVEFLVTAPLELITWAIQRLIVTFKRKMKKSPVLFIVCSLISGLVNIIINIITGIVRRFLAPARYLIRPSIELAKVSPKTFFAILGITLAVIAILAVITFTSGLSLIPGGIALLSGLSIKIAAISVAAVAVWALLYKCVISLCELSEGIKRAKKVDKASLQKQWDRVDTLNEQKGYPLYSMYASEIPKKDQLDKEHREHIPLLIRHEQILWIYGLSPKRETQLTQIEQYDLNTLSFVWKEHEVNKVLQRDVASTHEKVYFDIAACRGHFRERKEGTTYEISRALHGINPELAEIKEIKKQSLSYSLALFMGTEALCFPMKKVVTNTVMSQQDQKIAWDTATPPSSSNNLSLI